MIELRGNALITVILFTAGFDFLLLGYDQGTHPPFHSLLFPYQL
jgi:hypothetical protein